jgi:tRNA-Thr(GGU) m(6)t(6)A37 methyltransferase TsaA
MKTKAGQETGGDWPMESVAVLRSPFKEKFGIPRQPGLVDIEACVEMLPGYDRPEMFEGLEGFSHLWLSFVFHACVGQGWKPRVRPPRLGGNQRVGVFASRAPFRPNHLGLSVVELLDIDTGDGVRLTVRGADLLDGTPILDIKPYVPYVDAIPDARAGFAPEAPRARLAVRFSEAAIEAIAGDAQLVRLIEAVLAQDPRPAYQADDPDRLYGMRLAAVNVRFTVANGEARVVAVDSVAD